MTFTPEMANEIVEESDNLHTNFRKLKGNVARNYSKEMLEGKWQFCGDSIRFDKDGNCIDGQHRLRAIMISKIPQDFVVVEGLEADVAQVIDSGFKRSIEDYLKKQDEGYSKGATAIIRAVFNLKHKNYNLGQSMQNLGISNTDIVDEYDNDSDWYNKAASYGKKVGNESSKTIKPNEAGAIYYYLVRVLGYDKDYVEDFFFKLCNSARNDKSIYNTTMKNLTNVDKIGRSGVKRMMEYILCWNAMVNNCPVQRLKYSNWFEAPQNVESDETETIMAETA